MSEFVRVRKDEWEGYLNDSGLLVQRYEEMTEKLKKLRDENSTLQQKLGLAEERLRAVDDRLTVDLEESGLALRKLRADMSRVLQRTEKELGT